MKLRKRVLSVLLTLALLMTAVPFDLDFVAHAEGNVETPADEPEAIVEAVEEVPAEPVISDAPAAEAKPDDAAPAEKPVETEAPAQAPAETSIPEAVQGSGVMQSPEGTQSSDGDEAAAPTAAPEAFEEVEGAETEAAATVTPTPTEDPNAIDYTADAGKSPAFVRGYAEVTEDDAPVYAGVQADAEEEARLGRGVVYVLERTAPDCEMDRVRVAFNAGSERGIDEGWMNAKRVRPLEPETEVPAYLESCREKDELLFYKNLAELPLTKLVCVYPEPEATEPAETAAPAEGAQGEADTEASAEATIEPDATEHPALLPVEPEATQEAADQEEAEQDTFKEEEPAQETDDQDASEQEGAPETSTMPLPLDELAVAPEEIEGAESEMPIPKDEPIDAPTQEGDDGISTMPLPLDEPLFDVEEVAPEIDQQELTLFAGYSHKLNMKLPEGEAPVLTSSNIRVATVSEAGVVKAIAPGTATITLSAGGEADTCAVKVASAKITVKTPELQLGVGDRYDLLGEKAVVCADEGLRLEFSSSDAACVSVEEGVLSAEKDGTATIAIYEPESGETATLHVTVQSAATAVSIADSLELCEGMMADLGIKFTGGYSAYKLSCSDEGVVSVTDDGRVTALELGDESSATVTVTIRTANGLSDTCAVTVRRAPARIEVEPEITVAMGVAGRKIDAIAYDEDGNPVACDFAYDVTDPKVVEVENGAVTTLCAGSTTVTVAAKQNGEIKSEPCNITVVARAANIALRRSAITLGVGDEFQISDGDGGIIGLSEGESVASYTYAVYEDSNCKTKSTSCVSVSSIGLITAKKAGTAYVKIMPKDAAAVTLKVTVKKAADSVHFNVSELLVAPGGSGSVTVSFNAGAADYTVTSSDEAEQYIHVERDGDTDKWTITAEKVFDAPSVTLSVKSTLKGYSDTCAVRILPGPTPDELNELDCTKDVLGVGESGGKVAASVASGVLVPAGFKFNFKSSDEKILTVAGDGALTARSANRESVTITATASVPYDAEGHCASREAEVLVIAQPSTLKLNADALNLGVGDSYSLGEDPNGLLTVTPDGAQTNFTYKASKSKGKSNKTSVLTVDASGKITAKAKGTAYVRITPNANTRLSPVDLKVVVKKATSSIALSASAKTIGMGMKGETLTVKFSSSAYGDFTVENSDPGVLRLTRSGTTLKLTPVAPGVSTVSVRSTKKGYMDSCAVTVVEAPADEEIEFTCPDRIGVGEAGRAVSAVYPEGTCAKIAFKSSNSGMLAVDANTGALTVKTGTGKVQISVLKDGATAVTKTVEVVPAPSKIQFSKSTLSMEIGQTYQIPFDEIEITDGTSASYTFVASASKGRTNKTSVLSVGKTSGLITAKAKGTAYVRIKSQNAKAYWDIKVTVSKKNTTFKLTPASVKLGEGMTAKLTASKAPAGEIEFISSAPGIVEVDGEGKLTAIAEGSAQITAKVGEKVTGVPVTVTVLPAPAAEQIAFTETSTTRISANQKHAKVTATCAEGTMAALIYELVKAPSGISIVSAGVLRASANVAGGESFTVRAVDKNHRNVYAEITVETKSAAGINKLSPSSLSLGVGETYQISDGPGGLIKLGDGSADAQKKLSGSYTYTVYSNSGMTKKSTSVASVSSTGLITAKKAGKAYIKIMSNVNGSSKKLTVTVSKISGSITLSPATLTLGEFMKGKLTVGRPSKTFVTVTLESSDASVATVDASGNVTAKGVGCATITATTSNGKKDTALVRVVRAPDAIALTPAEPFTVAMSQKNVKVTARPLEEDALCEFTYASNSTGVLKVDANGELTPVKPGRATITAKVKGKASVKASVEVTVVAAPSAIALSASSIKLGVGNTYQISEYDKANNPGGILKLTKPSGEDRVLACYSYAVYKDSKCKKKSTSVASVSADGLVTARKKGTAYVKISTQNGLSKTLKVTVSKLASSVSLGASSARLGVGMSKTLTVSFPSKTYSDYAVSNSDSDIIKLEKGSKADTYKVTALAPGMATVTVRTANGKTDNCSFTVVEGAVEILWEFVSGTGSVVQQQDGKYIIGVGEKNAKIVATSAPEGSMAAFTFSSSNSNKLKVDASTGALTAVKTCEATITVSVAYNDKVTPVKIPIKVVAKPTKGKFTLSSSKLKLGVGDTFQITEYDKAQNPGGILRMSDGYSASYSFKSSNKSVATVSSAGLITAKKKGTAKIRITTQNSSVYRDLTVTVAKYTSSMSISPEVALGPEMTATLTPKFASKAYGLIDFESSDPALVSVSTNLGSGACTLKAAKSAQIPKKTIVTITATLRKTGATDTCCVTLLPAPQDISIDYGAMPSTKIESGKPVVYMGVKESGVKIVPVREPDETMCNYNYKFNKSGLSVSSAGALTGTKAGTYTVTVTASNNSAATQTVTVVVVSGPKSISFSASTLKLGVGDTFQLDTTDNGGIIKMNPSGSRASFKYLTSASKSASKSTKVISVSSSGMITAKKAGTAYVRVKAKNTSKQSSVLTVKVFSKPGSISLSPSVQEIGELSTGKVAAVYPANTYSLMESYESSNEELLTIDDGGNFKVEKLADGATPEEVTVTGTTQSGKSATARVKVLPHPTKVGFVEGSYEISDGMSMATSIVLPETGKLAQNFAYESSSNCVKIDEKGVITGDNPDAKEKTATITVTANPGDKAYAVSGTATVTVMPAPARISYEGTGLPARLNITKGDTITLPEPIAYTKSGEEIPATFTYKLKKSNDKSYVTLTGNKLKAVKKRTSDIIITVSAQNGVKTELKVRVYTNAIDAVKLYWDGIEVSSSKNPIPMYINGDHPEDSIALSVSMSGTNVNYGAVTYESSDEEIATVDASGVVTAHKVSSEPVTITATATKSGKAAECLVKVGTLANSYELTSTSYTLAQAESARITASFAPDGSGMRFSYATQNAKIVTVDRDGLLEGIAGGKTNVNVTDQFGEKTAVSIKVLYNPDSIKLPVRKLYMKPGESVTLTPVISREETAATDVNVHTDAWSSREELVAVTEAVEADQQAGTPASYVVTALESDVKVVNQSATISIQAYGPESRTVACEIVVSDQFEEDPSGFGWDSSKKLVIVKGDTAEIEYGLSTAAFEGDGVGCKVESVDNKLKVNARDGSFTAMSTGTATLKLTVGEGKERSVSIEVIDPVKPVLYARSANSDAMTEPVGTKATLDTLAVNGASARRALLVDPLPNHANDKHLLLGTFEVQIEDPTLLSYKPGADSGRIESGDKTGKTRATVKTFGSTVTVEITVNSKAYRALLISEWNGEGTAVLPFAQTNIDLMRNTLSNSRIDGMGYEISELRNPKAASIESGIKNTFANTTDGDISVVYIVAHGNITDGKYWFSGNNGISVYASTLMSWVHKYIKGKVLLIIDSCNSGQFITNQKNNIDKYGNIAVIAAQKAYKNASYYVKYKDIKTFEFFTRAFCAGLGNTLNVGSKDRWGNKSINADSNGDKKITISEAFAKAKSETKTMVNKYCYNSTPYYNSNKSGFIAGSNSANWSKLKTWYDNGNSQIPQYRIPSGMGGVVFFGK